MPAFPAIFASLPWRNSWFQIGVFIMGFSALLLVMDFTHGGGSSSGGGAGTSGQTPEAASPGTVPPAPANLAPQDAHAFTNSLGMKFVPAGSSDVLFSIWDTRVEDFRQFVNATGYNAVGGMEAMNKDGKFDQAGYNWQVPGFTPQLENYPVVGVSYADAVAFCQWLTIKERQSGTISAKQEYRLPTDAEWSTAAGSSLYPWGDQYPPTVTQGNYYRKGDGWSDSNILDNDGYVFCSPVGNYAPNKFGLYDMGGNVEQWVDAWYTNSMNKPETVAAFGLGDDGGGTLFRPVRGASWYHCREMALQTGYRDRFTPDSRSEFVGFRCVLTKPPTSWGTYGIVLGLLVIIVLGAWQYLASRKPATPPAEA